MVTMRSYSEEKRSGTIELLLTSPLKDVEIILGKFLGAMGMYLGLLAVTALYMSILFIYGNPAWQAGALGLPRPDSARRRLRRDGVVHLEPHQQPDGGRHRELRGVPAASGSSAGSARAWARRLASILSYLSITEHFDDFGKGIIDTKHVIFYLSFIVFGLFLATKSVDSDRWRG